MCNFDRAANGLVPVLVANWENFIFVNLNQEAPPLESCLGDLAATDLGFWSALFCSQELYAGLQLEGLRR